jgi:LL-diaminopimelate aminotransferase
MLHMNKMNATLPVDRLKDNFFAVLNIKISERMASGADIIRMDIGSPDLPPADHIIEAVSQTATRVDSHGYQSHRGTGDLRRAWISMFQDQYGVELDDEMVLPLMGSKEGVFHLSLAWLTSGDLVLVPNPGYQTYAQAARFAGAEVVAFPLLSENGYLPDFRAIPEDTARKARMLWLNYPNNPTGSTSTLEVFRSAVEFCAEYNILLCHDAAYFQVTFDGYQAPSIMQVPGAAEEAVEFYSLSKVYNMAGWRVGFVAGMGRAVTALLKLKTHADSGHFLPILDAATVALMGDQSWIKERNAIYQTRRDILVEGLMRLGLEPVQPRAAIYVWCPIPNKRDSIGFVLSLLESTGVSLAPGVVFGEMGEGFVRISLTQPKERIEEALRRMEGWL